MDRKKQSAMCFKDCSFSIASWFNTSEAKVKLQDLFLTFFIGLS